MGRKNGWLDAMGYGPLGCEDNTPIALLVRTVSTSTRMYKCVNTTNTTDFRPSLSSHRRRLQVRSHVTREDGTLSALVQAGRAVDPQPGEVVVRSATVFPLDQHGPVDFENVGGINHCCCCRSPPQGGAGGEA